MEGKRNSVHGNRVRRHMSRLSKCATWHDQFFFSNKLLYTENLYLLTCLANFILLKEIFFIIINIGIPGL